MKKITLFIFSVLAVTLICNPQANALDTGNMTLKTTTNTLLNLQCRWSQFGGSETGWTTCSPGDLGARNTLKGIRVTTNTYFAQNDIVALNTTVLSRNFGTFVIRVNGDPSSASTVQIIDSKSTSQTQPLAESTNDVFAQNFTFYFIGRSSSTNVLEFDLTGAYGSLIYALVADGSASVTFTSLQVYTANNLQLQEIKDAINNQAQAYNNINQSIQQGNEQAHQDAQKQYDYISDTTPASVSDTTSLTTAHSWLPAGPVDSLLNIPFTFLSTVISSLGGSCSTINAPLPFVNRSIQIPCFRDTFYSGAMAPLVNLIGAIPIAFILMFYFKHLYKRVERATRLETTSDDTWGVL